MASASRKTSVRRSSGGQPSRSSTSRSSMSRSSMSRNRVSDNVVTDGFPRSVAAVSPDILLQALLQLYAGGCEQASSSELVAITGGSSATVRRHLDTLCKQGFLVRSGKARATRYSLCSDIDHIPGLALHSAMRPSALSSGFPAASYPNAVRPFANGRVSPAHRLPPWYERSELSFRQSGYGVGEPQSPYGSSQGATRGEYQESHFDLPQGNSDFARGRHWLGLSAVGRPEWSAASCQLQKHLCVPLAARKPVSYKRTFVDQYQPNVTAWLPASLSHDLVQSGRMQGQQPVGTYARRILEQLLIDLSWSSSRLEGNSYSLLATAELFRLGGHDDNPDAVMLLNHKRAIEFLVDTLPLKGLSVPLLQNLHAILMQDLLDDSRSLGAIRQRLVNISDTVYVPSQVPALLSEMLACIVKKAMQINNPLEAAFFLWVNIAYLQPFDDGNKRTSRLAANIPLMIYNCAPLSFLDVDPGDYAMAMVGVYEFRDLSIAIDLFVWSYRRSLEKYGVVRESLGLPDPLRFRYREPLTEAICLVIQSRMSIKKALDEIGLTEKTAPGFRELLRAELGAVEVFNCARYRLSEDATDEWIRKGRRC